MQLDYIANLGFNAIWISPIVDNYDGAYHGYWGRDLYKINPNFGTAQDLKDLISACHSRDIWVMVDVVGNHQGNTDQNYEQNNPFHDPSHYHSYCIINDQDFQQKNMDHIENCRLAGLSDLN